MRPLLCIAYNTLAATALTPGRGPGTIPQMTLIDISVGIDDKLVTWQNETSGLRFSWVDKQGVNGSECCTSDIRYGSHLGTHIDAPLHFVEGGATVDRIELDILAGPALVVDMSDCQSLEVTKRSLEEANIPDGAQRVILRTSNSTRKLLQDHLFHEDFVAVSSDAADWLVNRGIRLVGIDYLSIGSAVTGSGGNVHRTLLGAGIVVLEGLDLVDVAPGPYTLICLPLKIIGAEGSPVRALLATPGHFS